MKIQVIGASGVGKAIPKTPYVKMYRIYKTCLTFCELYGIILII